MGTGIWKINHVKLIEPGILHCYYRSTHAALKIFLRIFGNSWYRLILC